MSTDSGHYEGSLQMDDMRRVQKPMFTPMGSSSKRTLFQDQRRITNQENASSGDESDLGPMSPLAFTDQSPRSSKASSICSTPGREFISPLGTPEDLSNSPVSHFSWDRLRPGSGNRQRNKGTSPFSTLRKISQAARHSTKRKIFPDSPQSLPSMPNSPCTPSKYNMPLTPNSRDFVPETPQKSFEIELQDDLCIATPSKSDSPEHRLITPLGSVTKSAPLPKLHRRKSLGPLETGEVSSPERKQNTLKRHAHDNLVPARIKFLKTDENCSIPRARAALFKPKQNEPTLDSFTLSTKSFYNSSEKKEKPENSQQFINDSVDNTRKRRSLPAYCGNHKQPRKRRKIGEINAGVRHGLKRPKPKRHSDEHKKDMHISSPKFIHVEGEKTEMPKLVASDPPQRCSKERSVSPVVDPNKKFFKTNRTSNHVATVTVNHKIKLKVADGKIALKQQTYRFLKNTQKPSKLADISFDATDLTVDEPALEASKEKSKVDSILKVLEDDWADDEYDTMQPLTNCTTNIVSPVKSAKMVENVLMSPASVLSNMTSTMNIADVSTPMDYGPDKDIAINTQGIKEAAKKYYPLFTKGYTMNNATELASATKSTSDGNKNTKWQMSGKIASAEDQYQLDVGQKHFGATQCPECQVVYQMGDPEDENAHLNYHNSIRTLKFPGWKKERIVYEDPIMGSRIILVEPDDPKVCWKKVSEILAVVDNDLGLADMSLDEYQTKKVYLYIQNKKVLGVLVAESIQSAHRMIPELIELDCCTAERSPAKCGINVVWTVMSNRKQGIATKLVDVLRAKYFYGYIMSLDDIAFSIPTPSGKKFAERYTKTKNFKVYN